MTRSIRQRLVASYALLAVLTVSVVGLAALSLVARHAEAEERRFLTDNAQAVARRALPLLAAPGDHGPELAQLARTAAFLGHAQVRILSPDRRVVADSGPREAADEIAWVMAARANGPVAGPPLIVMRLEHPPGGALSPAAAAFEKIVPPGADVTIVRRFESPWGDRLTFEAERDLRVEVEPAGGESAAGVAAGGAVMAERRPAADEGPVALTSASAPARPASARVVSVPVGPADAPLGSVELSGGPDFGSAALEATRHAFGLAALGAIALALALGAVVGRGLTAPLGRLAGAAARMSAGDLSVRAPVSGADEIGRLAAQFNAMAGRLETSFGQLAAERDALRRFIADASHELRTPITALKTFNALLESAADDDPAAAAEFLAESRAQIERLEWITQNLLDLSRTDAGLAALDLTVEDAGELVASVLAAFRPRAEALGTALVVELPEGPVAVRADRRRLELALTNLVDNALRHAPGGPIEVGAARFDAEVHLWVADEGPGVAPGDAERIFERFARGSGAVGEGSGLGLAIVRSTMAAHGGRAWVEAGAGGGSRFVLALPG